ncbi:hypothetical protein BH24ACT8_BH24ACT8_05410 [soil metagenome]
MRPMNITFDSGEPLEQVVAVVEATYGVRLEVSEQGLTGASADPQRTRHDTQRVTPTEE